MQHVQKIAPLRDTTIITELLVSTTETAELHDSFLKECEINTKKPSKFALLRGKRTTKFLDYTI